MQKNRKSKKSSVAMRDKPSPEDPFNGPSGQRTGFHRYARFSARATGHPLAFGVAAGVVIAWALTGPLFGFSDTWQLVINTGTTIVTFLMVFLIQNTQNRDSEALQLNLDELIRAARNTHNALLDIEELSESELDRLKEQYAKLAETAREEVRQGKSDFGTPDLAHRTS